jgi:twitching motility protein PilT
VQIASRRLGEFLVARKVLSRDALEALLEEEQRDGVHLSRLLVAGGLVSEKDLITAVASQIGVAFLDLGDRLVRPDVAGLVPEELARRHLAVAVDRTGTGRVMVAMQDPSDREVVAAIEAAIGLPIIPAIAVHDELLRFIGSVYGPSAATSAAGPGAPAGPTADRLELNDLLKRVVELGGSDLHLTVNTPPCVRIHGDLKRLTEYPVLNGSDLRRMIYGILTAAQRERFESELELDVSHSIPGFGRFRVNVFLQRDSVGAVMRAIPADVVPFESLRLPPSVRAMADQKRGLVLVTGPTGSGKSTTLASLVDIVNSTKPFHIMTVEDPIEFLHAHKQSIVNQREVGEDTNSFAAALRHALRQDPDVILVGEMRDLETIATAITAAETGHLVFGTLHTLDAPQSVDRIIDVFPAHQQQQVRVQLAASLQGVVTQQLIPARGGGRVCAAEVLVVNPAVRNLIREAKTFQIASMMQVGGRLGMQTMDQSLAQLVSSGVVDFEVAAERCTSVDDLRRLVASGAGPAQPQERRPA